MAYRKEYIVPGNYYHIYNRGNNFQDIFFETKNYHFFLKRLYEVSHTDSIITSSNTNSHLDFKFGLKLIAYCLMPNHYHLLVYIFVDKFLEKAMQRLSTSYTKAINKAYGRVGHLFQGRYKYKMVPENNYLLHLSRYIHLNPVRKCLVKKPEDWNFSSYNCYLGEAHNFEFFDPSVILEQVENYEKFTREFQDNQLYFVNKLLF